MNHPTPLLVLVPLLLSCAPAPSSSSSPSEAYQEKEINVRYVKKDLDQKAKLRFYEQNEGVPYMAIDDYYALLMKGRSEDPNRGKLNVEKDGDAYTVTSAGGKAIFNVEEDTLSSENLPFFTSTKTYESGYKAMMGTDGLPWIKIKDVKVTASSTQRLNFKSYHIDLHGDDKSLYLPLPTMQDLFSDTNLLTSFYNRKDLYVYSAGTENTGSFGLDTYEESLKTDLGKPYATYLYHEMCFDYDALLGRPTRSSLERYYDLSKGLDAALESRPLGRKIKQLLTDGTALGYATGLTLMGMLCSDGGHTRIRPLTASMTDPSTGRTVLPSWAVPLDTKAKETIDALQKEGYEELTNQCLSYYHHDEIRSDRKEGLGLTVSGTGNLRGEQTYKKVRSTAFICIDDYMGEYENFADWKAFYAGKGELPYGESKGGAVTSLYHGLLKAQKDEGVENVVIDLSSNMGGSADEMMYVISLLTGDATLSLEDRITGERLTGTFEIDRNLDRVFDEKDAQFNPISGKNVAVLMSQNGFSCGGISPIYLHDRGLFTLGDDSGGGCCSILYQHTGVGLPTIRSSSDAVLDKQGRKIDLAREGSCDHKLPIKPRSEEEDTLDFSAFFDVEALEAILKAHFATR